MGEAGEWVFISHVEEDEAFVRDLAAGLEREGFSAWFYERDAVPGPSYLLQTGSAIEKARAVLVVISRKALASHQMGKEIVRAHEASKQFVPVLLGLTHAEMQQAQPEWREAFGAAASLRVSGRKIGGALARIVAGLGKTTPGAEPPKASARLEDLARDPQPLLGRKIDHYLLREYVGAGGSGLVFKAFDLRLGREVCLKLFYPIAAEHAAVHAIIAAGVRAVAALRHPNVISVRDFGEAAFEDATSSYVVMEFVEGRPLLAWSMSLTEPGAFAARLRAAGLLARGLAAAHHCVYFDHLGFERTGVLHGDIKPHNVLVRPDGTPVLLDFMMVDLHRLLDPRIVPPQWAQSDPVPITGVMGTPGYMAPEQERDGVVSTRSDVFSLGRTLWQLFSPHWGQVPQEAARMLTALVTRMTARDPRERPGIDEVVAALDAAGAAT